MREKNKFGDFIVTSIKIRDVEVPKTVARKGDEEESSEESEESEEETKEEEVEEEKPKKGKHSKFSKLAPISLYLIFVFNS